MPNKHRFNFEAARNRYLGTEFLVRDGELQDDLPALQVQMEFARRVVEVFLSPEGDQLRREYARLLDEDEGYNEVILAAAKIAGPEVYDYFSKEEDETGIDRLDFFFAGGWDVVEWLADDEASGLWMH